MKLHRLVTDYRGDVVRMEPDGGLTRGRLFVDPDGLVRWIAETDVLDLPGEGYSPARGYAVVDDSAA